MHLNLHELQIQYLVVTSLPEISWLLQILYDLPALGWHFLLLKFSLIGSHPFLHLTQLHMSTHFLSNHPALHVSSCLISLSFSTWYPSWYPDLCISTSIRSSGERSPRSSLASVNCYSYLVIWLEFMLDGSFSWPVLLILLDVSLFHDVYFTYFSFLNEWQVPLILPKQWKVVDTVLK